MMTHRTWPRARAGSLCAAAWAQADRTDPKAAAEPVVKQLEAFRRDDFDTAFTFASGEIQAQFDRPAFETHGAARVSRRSRARRSRR